MKLAPLFDVFMDDEELHDDFALTCKTVVLPVGNEQLALLAEEMLNAAGGGQTRWFTESQLANLVRQTQWAISEKNLFGPKGTDLSGIQTPDDLLQFPQYRVRVVEVRPNKDEDKVHYIARLEPKALRSRMSTAAGEIKTAWLNGKPVLRVLYAREWHGLYETAKWISRVLPVGVQELIIMSHAEMPGMEPNSLKSTLFQINGVLALGVSINNPHQVNPQQVWQEAAAIMAAKPMRLRTVSVKERDGRITTVYPAARLLTDLSEVKDYGANSTLASLYGLHQTPIMYGATDFGGNWVELLQLYVACLRTGLPGVFDIDHRAHSLGSYFKRILEPSLALVGFATSLPEALSDLSDREIRADQLLRLMGVPIPERVAHHSARQLPDFYQALHREFVTYLNELLGVQVNIHVAKGTDVFQGVSNKISVGTAVHIIREVLQEDRVFANIPNGNGRHTVRLSEVLAPDHALTVEDYLLRHDAWPGGALTYLLMGALAHSGPLIFNLKDSRLGNVALASAVDIPGLAGTNRARTAISSIVRCYPKYANREGGDNVDLLVLFEMIQRYPERINALLQAMVERWTFPLAPAEAGLCDVYRARYNGGWDHIRFYETPQGTVP
jgi:hypothetical protein